LAFVYLYPEGLMIDYGNNIEVLGVLGLSWQEKLAGYIKTETGISLPPSSINKMNEAYTKGKAAGLSGDNLIDYVAAVSGVKNFLVSKTFLLNVEKYKLIPSGNPLATANSMLSKLVLLSGIALAGYFIIKSNITKRFSI
jgi:hypothetical protein